MFEPLRFIHAADVRLDQPLADVKSLSPAMQSLTIDATLSAFDRMVDGAIDLEADFVILAGNTFAETDQSLPARLCLLDGLRRLDEFGIEVFVLAGQSDPERAWRAIPDLPGNVTLLTRGDSNDDEPPTPVAVVRNGRVLATITAGTLAQLSAKDESAGFTNGQHRQPPFRVGLLTEADAATSTAEVGIDYLAVPAGQAEKFDDRKAHYPGPLQARFAHETGPCGAAMIEVREEGKIERTLLPFAPIRRLRWELPIDENATPAEVSELIKSRLAQESISENEQAWLINWTLRISNAAFQRSGLELPDSHPENNELLLEHQIHFELAQLAQSGEQHANELQNLHAEELESAAADEEAIREFVHEILESLDGQNSIHGLATLRNEINPSDVRSRALAIGREWFREPQEKGRP